MYVYLTQAKTDDVAAHDKIHRLCEQLLRAQASGNPGTMHVFEPEKASKMIDFTDEIQRKRWPLEDRGLVCPEVNWGYISYLTEDTIDLSFQYEEMLGGASELWIHTDVPGWRRSPYINRCVTLAILARIPIYYIWSDPVFGIMKEAFPPSDSE